MRSAEPGETTPASLLPVWSVPKGLTLVIVISRACPSPSKSETPSLLRRQKSHNSERLQLAQGHTAGWWPRWKLK